jgi:hypothetical protein
LPPPRKHRRSNSIGESLDEAVKLSSTFRPDEVGLFDPWIDTTSEKQLERNGRIVYKDVQLFIQALKDYTWQVKSAVVRRNVYRCFHGTVRHWYVTTLTQEQKGKLRGGHGIKRWERTLSKQFAPASSGAWAEFLRLSYGPKQVREGITPAHFVLNASHVLSSTGQKEQAD